jgi:hypothetical protein
MLMKNLGPEFVVWDKAAAIRFRKPGRTTLTATFRLDEPELAEIHRLLQEQPKVNRNYMITLVDANAVVHAEIDKVIHISLHRPS